METTITGCQGLCVDVLGGFLVMASYFLPCSSGWYPCESPEHPWYGVVCDPTNTTVVQLNLYVNGLDGTIPESIGDLPDLEQLDIYLNLVSNLPKSMTKLTKLKVLNLRSNLFAGALPNWFGNLTALTYVCSVLPMLC